MSKIIILLAVVGLATAYPTKIEYEDWILNEDNSNSHQIFYNTNENEPSSVIVRHERSLQPGAPNPQQPQHGSQISPQISRGQDGTTNVGAVWEKKTKDYDVNAQWNKNVRGPGRAKPTWSVGGTYRW